MVNRLAFPVQPKDGSEPFGLDDAAGRAVLRWASQFNLGQTRALLRQVAARRSRALNDAAASGRKVLRMRAKPEWRLAVGLGNRANAHEIGFALHGTYGWPVIPGSSLKGLSAAWAAREEAEADPKDALRV
ncbi:MAG TPA: type III-B CRISPR module RAMP protein Cmr6, partial [Streptosporangiaceae bacterium]